MKKFAPMVVVAAVGLAVGVWFSDGDGVASAAPEAELGVLGFALVLVGLGLIVLLALGAHEAGHLVGGWMSGFRFQLFVVGPLMLTRTADGIKAQLHTHGSLYGGLALSVPADLHDLPRRLVRMVAGGPAMSLLLGASATGAYIALSLHDVAPSATPPIGWMAAKGLFLFGALSLGQGLITLVPSTTSGFFTDGARLLRAWRSHPAGERDAAVVALSALLFAERPRDWDPALVEQATTADDETINDVEGRRLAYLHALDTGDANWARRLLQEALNRHALYPSAMRSSLTMEAAFFEGAVRRDADAAARWLALGADGALLDESARLRAQAAAQWAAGEPVTDALTDAREALTESPIRGLAAATRDWLDALAQLTPDARECPS